LLFAITIAEGLRDVHHPDGNFRLQVAFPPSCL
jgi:hypothetical protein